MKYYLDTNIVIYFIKGKYPALISHFSKIPRQSVVIPEIAAAEIEYGARKSQNYESTVAKYRLFLDSFEHISFSGEAARCYGKIRADMERKGTPIDPKDLIIAAIVMAENGTLITHNTKEFGRIEGLRIEDWTEE